MVIHRLDNEANTLCGKSQLDYGADEKFVYSDQPVTCPVCLHKIEVAAHDVILAACRENKFRTKGTWGMRQYVALGGYKDTQPRVPCAVIDLERSNPHPTYLGFTTPKVLSHGPNWVSVLYWLRANKELPE